MKTLDRLTRPVIQGGMGVGISLGGLAGAVAKNGGMGVISTANIGFREPDFWTDPAAANARALQAEIKKARQIACGKGLIAINAMVATGNFADMVKLAAECGVDAVISGAGLPLDLPELTGAHDVLLAPIVSSGKAAKMMIKVQPVPMLANKRIENTALRIPPTKIAGLNLPQGERMLSMTRPVMGSLIASKIRITDSAMLAAANTQTGKLKTSDKKYSSALASKA